MSKRNGDKSRFHRERKQNIQRRIRTRELLQNSGIAGHPHAPEKKPESTAGHIKNAVA
jgi:hypothetical protein